MEPMDIISRQAKEPEVKIETWFIETRLERFAASFEQLPFLWHIQHIDCDGIAPGTAEYLYLLDSLGEPCAGEPRARLACAKALCRVFCRLLRQKLRWAATKSVLDGTGEERALGMLPYWARQAERYMRYLPLIYLNTEQELKTKAERAARAQTNKEKRAQEQKSKPKEPAKNTAKPAMDPATRLLMQRVVGGMRLAAQTHGLGGKAAAVVAAEIGVPRTQVLAMWSSMRVLAKAKLKALLARGDGRAQTASQHLSSLDWAVADLIMMYEFSPVQESSVEEAKQQQALVATLRLVRRFQLEAEREPPPQRWHEAARWYCRTGSVMSPVGLQRRWHDMKEHTRRELRARRPGGPPPHRLHRLIAKKFPHVVSGHLRPWSELLAAGLVARPTDERGSKKRQRTAASDGTHTTHTASSSTLDSCVLENTLVPIRRTVAPESTEKDDSAVMHDVETNTLVEDMTEASEKSYLRSVCPGASKLVTIVDYTSPPSTSGGQDSSEENSNRVHTSEVENRHNENIIDCFKNIVDFDKEIIYLDAPSAEFDELKKRQELDDGSASNVDTEVVKQDFKSNEDVNKKIIYLDAPSAEYDEFKRLQRLDDRTASSVDTEVVKEDFKNYVDDNKEIIDLDVPSAEYDELKRRQGLGDGSTSSIDTEVVKENFKNSEDVNRQIIDLDAPSPEFDELKRLQRLDDGTASSVDTEVVKKEDFKNNEIVNRDEIDLDAPSAEFDELKGLQGLDDRCASSIDTEVVKEEDFKNNTGDNTEIIDLDAPSAEFDELKRRQELDNGSASKIDTEVVREEDFKNNVNVNTEIIDLDAPSAVFDELKRCQELDDRSASKIDTEVVKEEDFKNIVGDNTEIIDLDAPSAEFDELKRRQELDDRSASKIDTEVVKEEEFKKNAGDNTEIIDLDVPSAEFHELKRRQELDDRSASKIDTEVVKEEDFKNNVDVNTQIIDLDAPSAEFDELKRSQELDDRSVSKIDTEVVKEEDVKTNVEVNRKIIDLHAPSAKINELKKCQGLDDISASNIDTGVVKEEDIQNNVDVNRAIIDLDAPCAESDKFKSRQGMVDKNAFNTVKEVVKGKTATKAYSLSNRDDFATQVIRAIEQELFCERDINQSSECTSEGNSNHVHTNEIKDRLSENTKREGYKNNIDVNKEIIDLDAPSPESDELKRGQVLDDRNASNIDKEVVEGRITSKANNAPNSDDFATQVIRAIEKEIFCNRSSKFSKNNECNTTLNCANVSNSEIQSSSKEKNNDGIEKVTPSSKLNINESTRSVADTTHKHPMLTQMLQTKCIFDDDPELTAFLNKNKQVYRKGNSSSTDVPSNTNDRENKIKSLVENKIRKRVRAELTDDWAKNIVRAIKRQRLESAKIEKYEIYNHIDEERARGNVDKSNKKYRSRSRVSAMLRKTKSNYSKDSKSVTNLDSGDELYVFNVSSDDEDTSQDSEVKENNIDPKLLMYPVVVMARIEDDPSLRIVPKLPPSPTTRSPSPNLPNILESPSLPDIKLESPSPSDINSENLDDRNSGAEDTPLLVNTPMPEILNEKTRAVLKLCKPCVVLLERLEEVDKGIWRLAKRVELQDIDEVRRNNRRAPTAQVAPLAQDSESSSSDSHDSDWTPEMDTTRKTTTDENSDSISDSETDNDDDNVDETDDDETVKPSKAKYLNPDDHLKQLLNDFDDSPADAECCQRNKKPQLRGELAATAALAMKRNCARCLWQLLSAPPSSDGEAQLQRRLLRHTVLQATSTAPKVTEVPKQIPSGTKQIPKQIASPRSEKKSLPASPASRPDAAPAKQKQHIPAVNRPRQAHSQPKTINPVKQVTLAPKKPSTVPKNPERRSSASQVRLGRKEPIGPSTVPKNLQRRGSASIFKPGAVADVNEKLSKLVETPPAPAPGGFDPVITSVLSLATLQPDKNKKCPLVPKTVKLLQSNPAPTARRVIENPPATNVRQTDSVATALNVTKPSLKYVAIPSNSAQPQFNIQQPFNAAQNHNSQSAQLERDPTQCLTMANALQPQMNYPTPQHLPGTTQLPPAQQTVVAQIESQNAALQGTANVVFDPNTLAGNVMQPQGLQNAPWKNQGHCVVKQETSAFQPVMPNNANQPNPVYIQPNQPNSMYIQPNQPNSMYIQPNQLNPMNVQPNQPNPMYIQSNQPNSVYIQSNQPNPMCNQPNQPNPMYIQPNQFNPMNIQPNLSNSMCIQPNQPNPTYIQPNQSNPMYIQPNQSNPMYIQTNQPNPMNIQPNQLNPINIQPNQSNSMCIQSNQPNPMYIQPNQPNPMYIQANQPNPMNTQPNQPNPTQINQNQSNQMYIQPNQANPMYINPNQPNLMYINPNQTDPTNIQLNQPNLIRPNPMYINPNQSNAMHINPSQPNPIYPNQIHVNPNQPNPMLINPNQPNTIFPAPMNINPNQSNPMYVDQNQLNLMNCTQINQPIMGSSPIAIKMEQGSSFLPPTSHPNIPNPYGTNPGCSPTVPILGNSTLNSISQPQQFNSFNSMNAGSLQTLFNLKQEPSQSQSCQRPLSCDEAGAVLAGSQQQQADDKQGPSQSEDSKPCMLALDVKIGYCDADNEKRNSYPRVKWHGKPVPSHEWVAGRDPSRLAVLCTNAYRNPWALLGRYLVLSEEQPPPPNFDVWALSPRVRLRLPHQREGGPVDGTGAAQPGRLQVRAFARAAPAQVEVFARAAPAQVRAFARAAPAQVRAFARAAGLGRDRERESGRHAYAKVKLSDYPLVYAKLLVSVPSANLCRLLLKRGRAIQLYCIQTCRLYPILSKPTGPDSQFSLSGEAPVFPALRELARQLQD